MTKKGKLKTINKIIEQGSYAKNQTLLTQVVGDEELRWYFLTKLPDKVNELESLDFFWNELLTKDRPFKMFKIFENSISEASNQYILQFLQKNYSRLDGDRLDNLFREESFKIVGKILSSSPDNVDQALAFTKKVMSLRKNEYKNLDSKRDLERERDALSKLLYDIFSIYLKQKNEDEIEAIVKLIDKHFSLVKDDGGYTHYTSPEIFTILKEYILHDFENNFSKVVKILIDQYKKRDWYGRDWKGWDFVASGISQSGSEFSIGDKHYLTMTLSPALMQKYESNPQKTWGFALKHVKSNKVDQEHPDFLNRAVLPLLLKEYAGTTNSEEAFITLKKFICTGKGIPAKTELIFLAVYKDSPKLSDKKKWGLVKAQLNCKIYENLPANVFVEKITSQLAKKGHKEAIETLSSWPKSEQYRKRQKIGGFMLTENTWALLDNKKTFEKGVSSLKEYIYSDEFKKDLDTFDAWDVAKALTKVIEGKFDTGLKILQDNWDGDTLTKNQQIIVCSSINEISEEKEKLLDKVFDKFVKPNLEDLTNKEIEKKITFTYARESLVKFAEKLAKKKRFKESMWLLNVFIKDSDPKITKEDSDYHQQILKGENPMTIGTVRGWCAWVLQKFIVVEGQPYIDEVIDLTKNLMEDKNYYVRLQATSSLTALVRSRHSVLPNTDIRYMSLKQAGRIEQIAFEALTDKENQKQYAIMKGLARVFTHMRSLTGDRALIVLETFRGLRFTKDELLAGVTEEIAPLYVFYAEFRKGAFKEKKYQKLYGEKYWKQLETFDSKPFKKTLKVVLVNDNDSVRADFAWQFWKLTQGKEIPFEDGFAISYHYLQFAIKKYSHEVFENVYRFIEACLEKKPKESLSLWKKCLIKERAYFKKQFNDETWLEMHWWPFFYNGKILSKLLDEEGKTEFLKWLEFLVDYPQKAVIANDLQIVVDKLKKFPKSDKEVKRIFEKLIDRNAKYFDDMEEWAKQSDI